VLPTNVRLGVDQCHVTGVPFKPMTGKYWAGAGGNSAELPVTGATFRRGACHLEAGYLDLTRSDGQFIVFVS
jgi:hypothetical protein